MGTFNGNSVACAAGLATIGYLLVAPGVLQAHPRPRRADPHRAPGVFDGAGHRPRGPGFGGVFATYFIPGAAHGYRDLLRQRLRGDAGRSTAR